MRRENAACESPVFRRTAETFTVRGMCSFKPATASPKIFPRRRRVDGKRVHAAGEFAGKRRVDHAMAFEPALSAKGFRHDIKTEMRFAAWPVSGMTFMTMRFVLDVKTLGCESFVQLFRDEVAGLHRRHIAGARHASMPALRDLLPVKS